MVPAEQTDESMDSGRPREGQPFATAPSLTLPHRSPATFYGRLVVGIVLASILFVAGLAIAVGQLFENDTQAKAPTVTTIGGWSILVSQERPPREVILLALIAMALIAICAVSFEVLASLMSISPRRARLSALRGTTDIMHPPWQRVRVTVLIPAHNEEYSLPTTLAALGRQSRPPDRVIVIADNCTDTTANIAREMGHDAFETVGNDHKKGGALNQALSLLLPVTDAFDVVLVMDADTSVGPQFIEVAAANLERDPELAAVGGVFFGEPGHGLIGQFQRNEYARYSLQIRARRGRVFVLTGTATMFRASALMDVAGARGIYIPGEPGQVYDTAALTEDNELTLALKSLGATMMSPSECTVVTELMPAWSNLWRQRQRWQRGALENLAAYGMTRATIRYWGQQLGIGYGTVALNLALILMLITALSVDRWIWFPFWIAAGLVFLLERVITAWGAGWRGRLLSALLLPELIYDVYLQVVFINCLWEISVGRKAEWGHVQHPVVTQ
jgi:cellulose synthase/poly-beta-1,6-N-acetylglucosamine synthase-like glycosyltransferase